MKRLFVLFIILFAVLYSSNIIAQEIGSLKRANEIPIPEKIQKIVLDPLPAGTYSIGTGGYFSTIQSAFDKLSTDGVAGAVTLELIDELYTATTGQYGYILNGPIPGAGPNSRVTIKPAENKNVIIEGSNQALLYLINTSYVTFDGVAITGPTTLTIHALQNLSYAFNDALDFINDSDHDIIQNIIFIVEKTTNGSGSGFWCPYAGTTTAPDSNLIQNNFVKQAGIALYVSSENSSARANGNIIRGNQIGSETDSLISWGIQLEKCQNSIVENNTVQNIKTIFGSGEIINPGINSYSGSGDIIRSNIVHNIKSSTGYSSVGILLSGGSGSNNLIYNNMVYDIQSSSTQSNSRVAGIQIWLQTNPKIYYNTVYLSGSGANPQGSAAFYIYGGWGASTGVDLKDNIFINTRDESQYCASAIYDYNIYNLTSDYNDLFYQANQYNCLVRIGSTDYLTLTDWQAMGKDLHSYAEMPNFVSTNDLHIDINIYTPLDEHAIPISGIDFDFDRDTRNATSPDIGADEFDLAQNATVWQMQNSNFPSNVLVVDFSSVDEQVCWAVSQVHPGNTTPYAGYIRTTDGGNNWVCDTITGLTNDYFQQVFAIDKDTAYISAYKLIGTSGTSRGIYKTTDGGTSWNRQNAFNSSQSGPGIMHFFDSQNGVVIGDPNLETYTTSNGGLTWNPVTMPTPLSDEATWLGESRITAVGNTVWFSTNYRLFKSTDKGYTWTFLFNEQQYFGWLPSIAFQDNQTGIYALKIAGYGTNHIYKKTTDGGTTWSTLSNSILDNLAPSCIQYILGTNSVYVAVGGRTPTMRGTAVTYDAGESWTLIDTVGVFLINFVNDQFGWGSQYATNIVYKYVGPRIINSVEEEVIDLTPTGYSLSQNYPNPFNPSTTFRYSVPTQSKVVIKVYDILGNEIATLMDEEKSVGTHELTWNAVGLSSGIYFYQLKAGSYIETKKMILLK
ncbi:MAG: T9SS type A sorting domain-containing protein [bacterium]|nr:T9SS type A sorting domain-containing protein [bacterium]